MHSSKTKLSREHLNLNHTIRKLYQKAQTTTLLAQDKYLLDETLTALLKMPTGRKRGWILSMQVALRESEKTILRDNLIMRNAMFLFRSTGICRPATTRLESTDEPLLVPSRRKRLKRNPYRKRLRPLASRQAPEDLKIKRVRIANTNENTTSPHNSYSSRTNRLPTIQEEWDKDQYVRKK